MELFGICYNIYGFIGERSIVFDGVHDPFLSTFYNDFFADGFRADLLDDIFLIVDSFDCWIVGFWGINVVCILIDLSIV